jgi:hypothetical protein
MDAPWTELGMGGILAILILREVIPYVAKLNGRKNGCIQRSEFERHKETVQYRGNCEQIVKRMDSSIVQLSEGQKEIRVQSAKQFDEMMSLLRERA